MRLIDVDELIKDRVENDPVRITLMCAPTAYDVDKVVERLEEKVLNTSDTQIGISARMAFGKAIEIVKSGGID